MIKRKLTLALATLCVLQAAQANNEIQAQDDFLLLEQEKANNQVYKAFFPSLEIARKAAISFHGQLLESHYEQGYLIMELTEEEQQSRTKSQLEFMLAALHGYLPTTTGATELQEAA